MREVSFSSNQSYDLAEIKDTLSAFWIFGRIMTYDFEEYPTVTFYPKNKFSFFLQRTTENKKDTFESIYIKKETVVPTSSSGKPAAKPVW